MIPWVENRLSRGIRLKRARSEYYVNSLDSIMASSIARSIEVQLLVENLLATYRRSSFDLTARCSKIILDKFILVCYDKSL
jgi:hypothetical protein